MNFMYFFLGGIDAILLLWRSCLAWQRRHVTILVDWLHGYIGGFVHAPMPRTAAFIWSLYDFSRRAFNVDRTTESEYHEYRQGRLWTKSKPQDHTVRVVTLPGIHGGLIAAIALGHSSCYSIKQRASTLPCPCSFYIYCRCSLRKMVANYLRHQRSAHMWSGCR